MCSNFKHFPKQPHNIQAKNATVVLCNAHETTSSLYSIFKDLLSQRDCIEPLNDQEQDLLRAILVFAASGLDSMVKQLIREALPTVVKMDEGASKVFSGYIERKIFKGEVINSELIMCAMLSDNPKDELIKQLVWDLTSNSLQSKDELLKVASFFNIPSDILTRDFSLLKNIFDVRNQISHEMDYDYRCQNRRQRTEDIMIRYTNEIFRIADMFLRQVDNKL